MIILKMASQIFLENEEDTEDEDEEDEENEKDEDEETEKDEDEQFNRNLFVNEYQKMEKWLVKIPKICIVFTKM